MENNLPKYKWRVNLTDISSYRDVLMGFSILIIVLYHFCNQGGDTILDRTLRMVFSQGYVGVDIFMVLSGLGLTYSLLKNDNLKEYYIKRWVRIFPFFTFITLIECWIIRGESLGLALLRSTTLGYWFGFPYIDWYIPALVGLYAIYPLVFHMIVKQNRIFFIVGIGGIAFGLSIFVAEYNLLDWKHLAFLYRIPDFLMGCVVAIAIKNGYNEKIVRRYIAIVTLLGVIIFLTKIGSNYNLWFVNFCFTPMYLYGLCVLFRNLSAIQCGKQITTMFSFVGLFTLELYRISSSFERLLTNEICPQYHFLFVLLYLIISIILSYMSYQLFRKINSWLIQKLQMIKFSFKK